MILSMRSRFLLATGLLALALTASGCSAATRASAPAQPSASAPSADAHEHEHDEHEEEGHEDEGHQDAAARQPRLAVTYDGGVMVVDGTDLKVLKDFTLAGELGLHPSGDPRHPFVAVEGSTLKLVDLGSWSVAHGDHSDSKVAEPRLLDTALKVQGLGHVSPNGDLTAIFDDGDGSIEVFETQHLIDQGVEPVRTLNVPAHHGNAVPLPGGRLVHTTSTGAEVNGIKLLASDGRVVAESSDCPGLHGSAVAKESLVLGCADGVLLVKGDTITKVKSGPAHAGPATLAGSSTSTWVLGDQRPSKDAPATKVVLLDTATAKLTTVDLPAPYASGGLGFNESGQGVVLTTDGQLHVIEADHGHVEASVKVVQPFEAAAAQRPRVHVQGHWAYVVEPATQKVHAVELSVGRVMNSADLPHAPLRVTGTLG